MRESDTQTLLTPRELEVLAAMAEGMTDKSIARRLDISLYIVKFHVELVFRKSAHNSGENIRAPSPRENHAVMATSGRLLVDGFN
jgi:DNA-binding NarL/FixJ family response regulator